jgi:hypothetical protein
LGVWGIFLATKLIGPIVHVNPLGASVSFGIA